MFSGTERHNPTAVIAQEKPRQPAGSRMSHIYSFCMDHLRHMGAEHLPHTEHPNATLANINYITGSVTTHPELTAQITTTYSAHAKQICCSPKVSNSPTLVMQPPKPPVGISQTGGSQPQPFQSALHRQSFSSKPEGLCSKIQTVQVLTL